MFEFESQVQRKAVEDRTDVHAGEPGEISNILCDQMITSVTPGQDPMAGIRIII